MSRSAKSVPLADLGEAAARLVRRTRRQRNPVLITEQGRPSAVLVGIAAFERAAQERELLLQLARGEREIRVRRGFSLARVLSDVEKVLHRVRR